VALGLLALFEARFAPRWLAAAIALAGTVLASFLDAERGGFFQTSADHEQLVARRKDFVDSAVPAGNSLAADLLLRLGKHQDRPDYTERAAAALQLMANGMASQPAAFGRLLCALDFYLNPGAEIAIVGDPEGADTRALLAEVRSRYLPNSVLALRAKRAKRAPGNEAWLAELPLLRGRDQIAGRATAYVCRSYVCQLPVTDPAELARQL